MASLRAPAPTAGMKSRLILLRLLLLGAAVATIAAAPGSQPFTPPADKVDEVDKAPPLGAVMLQNVVTPVPLIVADPSATAIVRGARSQAVPSVYRFYGGVTNDLAARFHEVFTAERSRFMASVQDSFHVPVLDHDLMASPDFGYMLTAFNFSHPTFPISNDLAMEWASGRDGSLEENRWLEDLQATMERLIQPDRIPAGMLTAGQVQLVPVKNPQETLSLAEVNARGSVVDASAIMTASSARNWFRTRCASVDDPMVARSLSTWIQPNCLPDTNLTTLARNAAVDSMVVLENYAPGQMIAAKGSVVDARVQLAIMAWQQKISSNANAAGPLWKDPVPAAAPEFMDGPDPAPPATDGGAGPILGQNPAPEAISPQQTRSFAVNPGIPSTNGNVTAALNTGVTAGPKEALQQRLQPSSLSSLEQLLAIGAAAGFLVILGIRKWAGHESGGRRVRPVTEGRLTVVKPVPLNPVRENRSKPDLQTELAPQILQVLRQAFMHEMAGQRRDLLAAQQAAAAEVIDLVHRMDSLQVALQLRLRTYETQIQQLEAELTARREENQQLIRLKIQMIRHQAQLESDSQRVELN